MDQLVEERTKLSERGMGDFDPAFDLPDYYGEEDFYEDKYADELDMLDDFEEGIRM